MKICGTCCRHCLTMIRTKGFFAKVGMLAGMDVGKVLWLTRDEVEEFVSSVRRIEEECRS